MNRMNRIHPPAAHHRRPGAVHALVLATLASLAACANSTPPLDVTTRVEAAGANCALGGWRIDVRRGNTMTTAYTCSGPGGASATAAVADELPGANCAAGGKAITTSVGGGAAVVSYVCDPETSPVAASAVGTAEGPGAECAGGGVRIQSGAGAPRYVCLAAPVPEGLGVAVRDAGAACTTGGASIQVADASPVDVCNGVTGSAITLADEAPGSHCPNGGLFIQVADGTPGYVCNGVDGADGTDGVDGVDGQGASVAAEPPGDHCPFGGISVSVGPDRTYVCSGAPGADGTNGTNGTNGTDGQSAAVTVEPPGANCTFGGARIQVGEGQPSYVCHGAPGLHGLDATVTPEGPGTSCPLGGVKIQVGNGEPSYVCHGERGADGLSATVTPEGPGANCPAGGVQIRVGSGEPSYVCHGERGADGLSATVTPEDPGANCPYGGVRIQVGEGAPAYACNGAPAPCSLAAGPTVTSFTMAQTEAPYTATVIVDNPGQRRLTYMFLGEGGQYTQIGASNQFTFTPTVHGAGPFTHYVIVEDGCFLASRALAPVYTPPDVVTAASATPLPLSAKLDWTNPAQASFDHVEISGPDFATVNVASPATTATITGLAGTRPYTFTIKAVDGAGRKSPGVQVSATPIDIRRIFISTGNYAGGGVSAMNATCQAEATAAGLPGTYAALVSTSTSNAKDLTPAGYPFVDVVGTTLAPSATALWTTGPLVPLRYTATGQRVDVIVWSGTGNSGSVFNTAYTCNDWTATTPDVNGMYGTAFITTTWMVAGARGCNEAHPFYCVQLTGAAPSP